MMEVIHEKMLQKDLVRLCLNRRIKKLRMTD